MPIPEYVQKLREKVGNDLLMYSTVAAAILDERRHILLIKRADNGRWALPGGIVEPGEQPADTLVREVYEETGLNVIPIRIVGVYGGMDNVGTYPNGDRYAMINTTFKCDVYGGSLNPASEDETLDLRYFSPTELPSNLQPSHLIRIVQSVQDGPPAFTYPTLGSREDLILFVQDILDNPAMDDTALHARLGILTQSLPDPYISDYIFLPTRYFGTAVPTAQQIVDKALSYRPLIPPSAD